MEKREKILAEELRKTKVGKTKRKLILKGVKDKEQKQATMKHSIKEGAIASVGSGVGDAYIIPYALALNANNLQIGLLKSFSSLLPPISQLYGSKLMEKKSRKKIIVTYVALQAFMWLPIIFLSLFFWKNLFQSYLPYFLIAFYTLYAIFGSIASPAWFSLLGDIVPETIRGRYFGKRNRIAGIAALISTLTAAFLLDFFKTRGFVILGFSILFLIASIARSTSAYLFKKHYEPKFKLPKKYFFSFWQFLSGIRKYNFTKFSLFSSIMHLSVMFASPFFIVYMLEELGFSYVTFIIVTLFSSLASLLMMPIWGRFSDKYGRKETILISTILISIMPILWLFSKSPYYLAFPMLLSGVGWAGFNLSAFNFIYDSVSQQRRGLCIAYFNILGGIGAFIGATLGGFILFKLPLFNFTMNKFLIIFLISAFLRAMTSIIFLPRIKEVRKVKKFNPVLTFRKMRITNGLMHEIADGFHYVEKKLGV